LRSTEVARIYDAWCPATLRPCTSREGAYLKTHMKSCSVTYYRIYVDQGLELQDSGVNQTVCRIVLYSNCIASADRTDYLVTCFALLSCLQSLGIAFREVDSKYCTLRRALYGTPAQLMGLL